MAQCSECGKMSKTRAGLLRHIRGHANSGNYNCCGKAFQVRLNTLKIVTFLYSYANKQMNGFS